jgi:hypothetical protein
MFKNLIFIFIFGLIGCASDATVNKDLSKIPQNNLLLVTDYSSNTKCRHPNKLVNEYLMHYFSPWQQAILLDRQKNTLDAEQKLIEAFSKHPNVGGNAQLHEAAWIRKIVHNMNLAAYPNLKMTAIVTRDTILRLLPTMDPSFSDWYKSGQGYPFDNLQMSVLSINTPIYVLHESRNGEWVLVLTPYKSAGWIKTLDIGYIDNKYVKQWMVKNYVVATFDNQSLFDQQSRFYANSRIGQLFPLNKITKFYYQVIIPLRNDDGYAVPKIVNLRKTKSARWPMAINQKNIARLANNMLGQPYGWGELNSYRDCSSAMEALFAPFAIWLPRNSKDQAMDVGQFIDLSGYSSQRKLNLIVNQGNPFLTLLWGSGHIMLYIGVKDNQAYIFHNVWALRTKNYFSDETGRAIIGRSAIMPLDFGSQYLNLEQTFLERTQGMTLLL